MSNKSNKNALVHGVYSSDVILPGESAEEFNDLLAGIRLDLKPNGIIEDNIVFNIGVLHWKKCRVNRMYQLRCLSGSYADQIEKSGKRSAAGIHRFLKTERMKGKENEGALAAAAVTLSEAMNNLSKYAGKAGSSLVRVNVKWQSVKDEIEQIQSRIEAQAKSEAGAKTERADQVLDIASGLDDILRECEVEARIDALIDRKIRRLIEIKEYQRLYGQDSSVKLIEHRSSTAKDVSPKPSVAKVGSMARTKKSKSANDNWNDDNNDNNNNNEGKYDWDHEYVEAQAEKKARQERRARKG